MTQPQEIDPKIYQALAITASPPNSTRFYLQGIYIAPAEDGGTLFVSIDGYRMSVYHSADIEFTLDAPVILSITKPVLAAAKELAKTDKKMELTGSDLRVGKVTYHDMLIDATYPDWERVLPTQSMQPHNRPIVANSKYIADFGKISAILTGNTKSYAVSLFSSEQGASMAVRISNSNYYGVLMSLRLSASIFDAAFPTVPKQRQST